MTVFWFGPAGRLRRLPSPDIGNGPEATVTRFGAVHRGLNGTPTVDMLGSKRTWTFTWPYLDGDTARFLDLMWRGMLDGPLRLIDPQYPNLLPARVASGGSIGRDPNGFIPTSGTVEWSPGAPASTVIPLAAGIVTWRIPATAPDNELTSADTTALLTSELVTFSLWASSFNDFRLIIRWQDATGDDFSTSLSSIIPRDPVYVRYTLTAVPQMGAVTCRVGVRSLADGTERWLSSTGWQLEVASRATEWTAGDGCSTVVIESLSTSYPVPGRYATTLTLLGT